MFGKLKSIGPGVLVASAFIGPGTVTICSIAGNLYGYTLLWALVFSLFATIVLQEMCARLGIISQQGLGKSIIGFFQNKLIKIIVALLIFSGIIIGNGAYEAGNISGAVLGINALFNLINNNFIVLGIGLIAAIILFSGSYKVIERIMISLVVLMSIVFLATAIYINPDFSKILKGAFIPSFPDGSWLVIMGLIGTTVVPYNLFLHTSSATTKWKDEKEIKDARFDTIISVILGGVISMAIVITSASVMGNGKIFDATDLALQLEPMLGVWAGSFIAVGLFAAGISSAVTAPLAAGYAAAGIFGFRADIGGLKFRLVTGFILLTGIIVSVSGFNPVEIIKFAQVANGILLPLVATFLVWVMNKKQLLKNHINNNVQNLLGILVILVTIILGVKSIISAIGLL